MITCNHVVISRYIPVQGMLVMFPLLVLISACESELPDTPATTAAPPGTVSQSASTEAMRTAGTDDRAVTGPQQSESGQDSRARTQTPIRNAVNPQFSVGTGQYMFDVSNHSQKELAALLQGADEIAGVNSPGADELDIDLILHGPDIGWFAKQDYKENKELIDLTARLGALEIVDLKICQQAMQQYGYLEYDIPTFIDRVSYAPDERQRLEGSGYFSL
ncbi:MAG: DsrE family protein [Gammaproteobacteria bacterium]|nr:DsrE family protein [Gammaproteobacteria bacterium]